MNGFLFFAVIIYLVFKRLERFSIPLLRADFFLALQKSLRGRDYLFRKVAIRGELEECLRHDAIRLLKQGLLRADDLDGLQNLLVRTARQQEDLRSLSRTYGMHLGFAVLTPLLFRLGLSQKLWFDSSDLLELGMALFALMALLHSLIKIWPRTGLLREAELADFIRASLGDEQAALWKEAFQAISREAWLSGIDGAGERRALLKAWQEDQITAFDRRVALLEDSLGPLELLTTCVFGVTLLGLPLLSHLSGLVD